MTAHKENDLKSAMERHAQSVLALLIMALVTWVGVTIIGLKDATTEIRGDVRLANVQIEALREQIKLSADDRYRKSQAEADFRLRDQRIENNERRISNLENKAGIK